MLVDRMLLEMSKIHDNLISSKPRDMLKEYAQKDGIAIWGTGLAGACAHDYCRKHKIRVTCAVDSFVTKRAVTFTMFHYMVQMSFSRNFQTYSF